MWQMNEAFMAAKAAAANVPGDGEAGSYTAAIFQEDFPQFLDAEKNSLVPEKILDQFISQRASLQVGEHVALCRRTLHGALLGTVSADLCSGICIGGAGSSKSTADRRSQVGDDGGHHHQL